MLISVVIPVRNEEDVLPELHRRLTAVLRALHVPYELLFVNDGSTDRTPSVLAALRAGDPAVAVVDLSRGFGKEVGISVGPITPAATPW
jgi:glycosyltransferase involved in cell wall biosynthesis